MGFDWFDDVIPSTPVKAGNNSQDVVAPSTTSVGGSWWDDAAGFVGGLWDSATDVVGNQFDSWLSDEIGQSGSPENNVEHNQAPNADVSNAPITVGGYSISPVMIGGALVLLGAVYMMARK